MSESVETTETSESVNGAESERKRRRLRPNEVAMLRKYIAVTTPGEVIQFNDIPDIEMKRALFPSSQLRLVEKELLETTYDETTGMLLSVSVNPDMLDEYDWDIKAPEPKVVQRTRTTSDEPKMRRVRGALNNDNYRIKKLKDTNPKRQGTHGWYNWDCYKDGMSIPEYLGFLDYDRTIKVHGKFGTAWFNGPDTLYLYQDFKAENIGIYDSSKSEDDADYWIKPDATLQSDMEKDESPDDIDSENGESTVVGETESTPPVNVFQA